MCKLVNKLHTWDAAVVYVDICMDQYGNSAGYQLYNKNTGHFQIALKTSIWGSIFPIARLPLETQSISHLLRQTMRYFVYNKLQAIVQINFTYTCCHKHSETKLTSSALPRKS